MIHTVPKLSEENEHSIGYQQINLLEQKMEVSALIGLEITVNLLMKESQVNVLSILSIGNKI